MRVADHVPQHVIQTHSAEKALLTISGQVIPDVDQFKEGSRFQISSLNSKKDNLRNTQRTSYTPLSPNEESVSHSGFKVRKLSKCDSLNGAKASNEFDILLVVVDVNGRQVLCTDETAELLVIEFSTLDPGAIVVNKSYVVKNLEYVFHNVAAGVHKLKSTSVTQWSTGNMKPYTKISKSSLIDWVGRSALFLDELRSRSLC